MKTLCTLLATTAVAAATSWGGRSGQETSLDEPAVQATIRPPVYTVAPVSSQVPALGILYDGSLATIESSAPAADPVAAQEPDGPIVEVRRMAELARLKARLAELEAELARRTAVEDHEIGGPAGFGRLLRDVQRPDDPSVEGQLQLEGTPNWPTAQALKSMRVKAEALNAIQSELAQAPELLERARAEQGALKLLAEGKSLAALNAYEAQQVQAKRQLDEKRAEFDRLKSMAKARDEQQSIELDVARAQLDIERAKLDAERARLETERSQLERRLVDSRSALQDQVARATEERLQASEQVRHARGQTAVREVEERDRASARAAEAREREELRAVQERDRASARAAETRNRAEVRAVEERDRAASRTLRAERQDTAGPAGPARPVAPIRGAVAPGPAGPTRAASPARPSAPLPDAAPAGPRGPRTRVAPAPSVARLPRVASVPPVAPVAPMNPFDAAGPSSPARTAAPSAPARALPPVRLETSAPKAGDGTINIHVENGDVNIYQGGAPGINVQRRASLELPASRVIEVAPEPAAPKAGNVLGSRGSKDRVSDLFDPERPRTRGARSSGDGEPFQIDAVTSGGTVYWGDLRRVDQASPFAAVISSAPQALDRPVLGQRQPQITLARTLATVDDADDIEHADHDELLRLVREIHAEVQALRAEMGALRARVDEAPERQSAAIRDFVNTLFTGF